MSHLAAPRRISTPTFLVALGIPALAALLGFGYLTFALVCWITGITLPPGWTSTIVIILFLGGVQLMVLGILGDYIGRIFDEVKNRPHYVPRATLGWLDDAERLQEPALHRRAG